MKMKIGPLFLILTLYSFLPKVSLHQNLREFFFMKFILYFILDCIFL